MSASRGTLQGPWPTQGQVPHRSQTATQQDTMTNQAGLRLSPIYGSGMPRQSHPQMSTWNGPQVKPMAQVTDAGTVVKVDTTGLNQTPAAIPRVIPIMGPTMSGQAWGALPQPSATPTVGYGVQGKAKKKGWFR